MSPLRLVPVSAALLVSVLLVADALAKEAAPLHEVAVTRDVAYVSGEAVSDRQKLDLYVPEGDGPWPVLMWIHGGAWAVGHRKDEAALARRFAERGVAVAAIDHRMSKALWIDPKLDRGVEHPAHVEDCAAAFAWLHAYAGRKESRLDPKRIFVGGFSSGAHLSALLATDAKYLKAHELPSHALRGALPVGGAYDMEAYYEAHLSANGKKMAEQHVLDVFGRDPGALADASPTTHMTKTKVPMLVISERNTLDYTKLFEEAVKKAGIDRIRFVHFANRTHRDIGPKMARDAADEPRDQMISFIQDPSAEAKREPETEPAASK